uniref:Uncharacterized protein n=1 Tax=Romanomermis culicivorax TaxID=13658 RepID=A0A915KSK7_ROMCU
MKKVPKPKLTVWKQPGREPKLSLLLPELAREDNAEQMANMEETIEQVAKKFANLPDDRTNLVLTYNPRLTLTLQEIDAKLEIETKTRNENER